MVLCLGEEGPAWGWPQFGHMGAASEIWVPQFWQKGILGPFTVLEVGGSLA
jgi:hypothetical protein